MHDFKKQITYINQFKLFHKSLNVKINKVILIRNELNIKGISKYEINLNISNNQNTINIQRRIELILSVELNDNFDEYSLSIHIIKAPSILHNKKWIIHNIFNNYDVLKYLLCETLFFLPHEILTIICNQFLSKYFWIFPTPFIHHSLVLNNDITDRLPFEYQLYYGYNRPMLFNQPQALLNHQHFGSNQQSMIESVKYVGYENLNQSKLCQINGISVKIKIDDKKQINLSKYESLFDDLESKYDIKYPELSTILPFDNPSCLYKLKEIRKLVQAYFEKECKQLIKVNAKLLIDRNIDSHQIAMLWINWKPLHKPQDNATAVTNDWLYDWDDDWGNDNDNDSKLKRDYSLNLNIMQYDINPTC